MRDQQSSRAILFFSIALLIAACGAGAPIPTLIPTDIPSTNTPIPTDTPIPPPTLTPAIVPRTEARNAADQAYLRVIHAAPETETIDVYVESLPVAVNLNFNQLTEREGIEAGDYVIRAVPTGNRPDESPLTELPVSIQGEQSLILLVTGTVDALSITIVEESQGLLDRNISRVNFIHAVPRGPQTVVLLNNADVSSFMEFGQVSEGSLIESGLANFAFQSGNTTLLEYSIELFERRNHTLILVGKADQPDSFSIIAFDSPTPIRTQVSFINAAPDMGPVDLYLEDLRVDDFVDYGEGGVPVSVPSGTYNVEVYAAGVNRTEITPLTGTQFLAFADEDVTLILVGNPEGLRLVEYRNDLLPTAEDEARITFLNTLETVPRTILQSEGELHYPLSYGQISDTLSFETLPVNFYWYTSEGPDIGDLLETIEGFEPLPGFNYLYMFAGRLYDTPLIYEYEVGTNGTFLNRNIDVPSTVEPILPTRIRLVNAKEGLGLDFQLDDTLVVSRLEFGNGSPVFVVESGDHTITAHNSDTGELVARAQGQFLEETDYTVLAFGLSSDLEVIKGEDRLVDSISGSIRLINVSEDDDVLLGAGYAAPTNEIEQPYETIAGDEGPPIDENQVEAYRISIPFGIENLFRDIPAGTGSETARIPAGRHNIPILDTTRALLAYIASAEIESGTHYDIIAFQVTNSFRIDAFVLPYPAP